MSEEPNAYAVVIEDLKRQRDEIGKMIVRLEAMASGNPATVKVANATEPDKNQDQESDAPEGESKEGEFLGMTVIQAARKVLERQRRPMGPAEITKDLRRGGLILTSPNTVGSILHRRGRDKGDFVSPQRGVWGLKEWYRGRKFAKSDESDKTDSTEPSEPEQPSEQPQIVPLRSGG